MLTRRSLLKGAAAAAVAPRAFPSAAAFDPRSWSSVRAQFALDPRETNFATFLLAAHPRPVRDAVARYARALDRDAKRYLDRQEDMGSAEQRVRSAAARYLNVDADELALTDSTTMGLGLLYGGLILGEDDEVVTTTHDFFSTHEALRLRALRTGVRVRKIRLYDDARTTSVDEIVSAVRREITPKTRALAVTWVHSSTGVKLPIRAIADALPQRVLLCVDGVHGFGIENVRLPALGCDFFVAGCHKWLFGPRGTGLVWGRPTAWRHVTHTIPSFTATWTAGGAMTPGGFHSFEHRWALAEAFRFQQRIGRQRIAARTHALNAQLKSALAGMPHVTLHTPPDASLSAGLVCLEVWGLPAQEVVERLAGRGIVATVTPYTPTYARVGPSILNTPAEIRRAVRALRALR